ncbi:hypothetical protein ACHAQJ_007268 [Trichoderma viride]
MTPNAYTQSSEKSPSNGDANPEVIPDLTTSEIRQARRRVQNRVNQRAYRSRARQRKVIGGGTAQPYRVHRWRIDDEKDDIPTFKPKGDAKETKKKSAPSNQLALKHHPAQAEEPPKDETHSNRALVVRVASKRFSPWLGLSYCLLSDHLLHLIHFNVLRGLSFNKKVLKPGVFLECSNTPSIEMKRILPHMPDAKSLTELRLPENLAPTNLQLTRPHSTWIDVFPFPKMRDNLIRKENYFSHAEFLTDLLGNLINCMGAQASRPTTHALPALREDDDTPTDRKGLILWGEPYQRDSWEVTPAFLRNWSWALEGCGELIVSTNKWRTARGETPLRMAALSQ